MKNKRIIKKLDGNKKKDGNGLNRDERIIFCFFKKQNDGENLLPAGSSSESATPTSRSPES